MWCSSKAAYGFWCGDIADNPLQMLRCGKSGIKQKRVIARSPQGDAAISGRFGTVSTRLLPPGTARQDRPSGVAMTNAF
jgi:hypothetical protein